MKYKNSRFPIDAKSSGRPGRSRTSKARSGGERFAISLRAYNRAIARLLGSALSRAVNLDFCLFVERVLTLLRTELLKLQLFGSVFVSACSVVDAAALATL